MEGEEVNGGEREQYFKAITHGYMACAEVDEKTGNEKWMDSAVLLGKNWGQTGPHHGLSCPQMVS